VHGFREEMVMYIWEEEVALTEYMLYTNRRTYVVVIK
jgi:hypothetical protein